MAEWVTVETVRKWGAIGTLLVALGVWAVIATVQDPDSGPTSPVPTTTTSTVPASGLRDEPWWATPVDHLEPGEARWADRLCRYADVWGSCGDLWATEMGLGDRKLGNDYSVPVYDASTATTSMEVRRKTAFPGIFNIGPGERVAWNPSWLPPAGKDGYMVVRDPATGHEWAFWNVSWWSYQTDVNNNAGCVVTANLPPPLGVGYDPHTMLCAASAFQVRDSKGRPVDTRTWSGNFPASGGGWHVGPLVVTPTEVAAGEIRHALHFYSANTMDGPVCPPDQRGPDTFGVTCGGAVAPAGQLEKHEQDGQPLTHQVPEGTRFSLELTDAQIEAWLYQRGYTGKLRSTARTVAVALRDYGWFLGDSSPTSAHWEFDGSPQAQQQWRDLGVQGDGKDLLAGLVTAERLRVWAPPVLTCTDGTTTTWFCRSDDGRYPR